MAALLDLSNELLIQISDDLYLPDLEHFAAVSPSIYNLCERRIEEHRKSRDLHRHKEQAWRRDLPGLLMDICRLDYAPYVEELVITGTPGDYGRRFTLDNSATFAQAVQASPWIPSDEESRMVESTARGDWDPVLCVILPLLRNLTLLSLPYGLGRFSSTLVMRIASCPRQSALTNLQQIECKVSNGIGLIGAVPFLALPSVQSGVFGVCNDDNFEWPSSLPKSHVRSISLIRSSVSSEAIRGLASGIVGPCEIRQERGSRSEFSRIKPDSDWDYCEIPFAGAGPNDLVVKIEGQEIRGFDGGDRLPWAGHCKDSTALAAPLNSALPACF